VPGAGPCWALGGGAGGVGGVGGVGTEGVLGGAVFGSGVLGGGATEGVGVGGGGGELDEEQAIATTLETMETPTATRRRFIEESSK